MSTGAQEPAAPTDPTIDVVVPTYHRPAALARCIRALGTQTHAPARVVVVARRDDHAAWEAIEDAATELGDVVRGVAVGQPGIVAALAAGVAATSAPLVGFTDDDAAPHADWLERLVATLARPGVGGAGGRDVVPGELAPRRASVGLLSSWGRLTGDHHLGTGLPRFVHVLKGVNMAFRVEALALPRTGLLRGEGAETHNEDLICAWALARGWRLVYDPAILVDHRVVADERIANAPPDSRALRSRSYDDAHNRMLAIGALDPTRRFVGLAYALVVGCREAPGAVRAAAALARGEADVARRLRPALAGTLAGASCRVPLDVEMRTCAQLRGA